MRSSQNGRGVAQSKDAQTRLGLDTMVETVRTMCLWSLMTPEDLRRKREELKATPPVNAREAAMIHARLAAITRLLEKCNRSMSAASSPATPAEPRRSPR